MAACFSIIWRLQALMFVLDNWQRPVIVKGSMQAKPLINELAFISHPIVFVLSVHSCKETEDQIPS